MLLFMSECEGPVTPAVSNIETSVSGIITGTNKDLETFGVEGIKVKVAEYLRYANAFPNPSTYEFIQFVDSTFTDANGHYGMTFLTSGQGSNYFIEIEQLDGYHFYLFNREEIEELGSENTIYDINCRILYPIEFEVNSSNVQTFPLLVRNDSYYGNYIPDTINFSGTSNLTFYGLGESEFNSQDTLEMEFWLENIGYGYKRYLLDIPNIEIDYENTNFISLDETEFTN